MDLVNVDFSTFSLTFKSTHNLSHQYVLKHRRYAQYTEGIESEAKTKQLEQLIIEE